MKTCTRNIAFLALLAILFVPLVFLACIDESVERAESISRTKATNFTAINPFRACAIFPGWALYARLH